MSRDKLEITFEGLDEIVADTQRLIDDLQRGIVFEAAAKTHRMPLVVEARRECPKDTGELASTIKTRIEPNTLYLEATADHAKFVHDGTSLQRANPFLDRTVRRMNADLEKRIATEIAKRFK